MGAFVDVVEEPRAIAFSAISRSRSMKNIVHKSAPYFPHRRRLRRKIGPRARRRLGEPPRYSTPALDLTTPRAHLALQRYGGLLFEFIGRPTAWGLETKILQLNSTSYDRSQVSLGTSLAFRISTTIASARISTSSSNGESPYKLGSA